jgi:hypothetical protein
LGERLDAPGKVGLQVGPGPGKRNLIIAGKGGEVWWSDEQHLVADMAKGAGEGGIGLYVAARTVAE